MLALPTNRGASESGGPAAWVSWVKIVLGVLLLLVAIRQFRGRPRGADGEDEPQAPKWMAKINTIKPAATLGLAAVLAGANPKNLLLITGCPFSSTVGTMATPVGKRPSASRNSRGEKAVAGTSMVCGLSEACGLFAIGDRVA